MPKLRWTVQDQINYDYKEPADFDKKLALQERMADLFDIEVRDYEHALELMEEYNQRAIAYAESLVDYD